MGTMLSEGLKSRDSLKLSFNRSISEPGHAGLTTCPMAPLTSPPSLGPSLHPPKRCRMDGLNRSKPLSLAPPSSFLSPPAPPGGVVSLPASPCSESVTMQRSMVMQQATTISGDQLAKRLRAREGRPGRQSFLLLDCRPFIAYNVGHVRGAINVNCCDRFNRKRLQQTTQSSLCEDHLMRPNHCPTSLSVPGLPAPPSPSDLCVTKDIENHPASQVTPFLFLGNMKDASDAN